MTSQVLLPWNALIKDLSSAQRTALITAALENIPRAQTRLRSSARRVLNEAVKVPGYRTIETAPLVRVMPLLVYEMGRSPEVAAAVVNLWADGAEAVILQLAAGLQAAGCTVQEDWGWQEAAAGYVPLAKLPIIGEVIEEMVTADPILERFEMAMAAMWLSSAVTHTKRDASSPHLQPEASGSGGGVEGMRGAPCDGALPPVTNQTADHTGEDALATVTTAAVALPLSLIELRVQLQQALSDVDSAYECAEVSLDELRAAFDSADAPGVATSLETAAQKVQAWMEEVDGLASGVTGVAAVVMSKLRERPDLDAGEPFVIHEADKTTAALSRDADTLLALIALVETYDAQRQALIDEILEQQGHWEDLADLISLYESGTGQGQAPFGLMSGDMTVQTLSDLQVRLRNVQEHVASVRSLLHQLRTLALGRVDRLASRLIELGEPPDTAIDGSVTLGSLTPDQAMGLTDEQLRRIEIRLGEIDSDFVRRQSQVKAKKLIEGLRRSWDGSHFIDLLSELARKQRDVEAVLLLGASRAEHGKTESLVLPGEVIDSMLKGVAQLSSKSTPFEMLALLAPVLFTNCDCAEPETNARLRVLLLAAHHTSGVSIPSELLWQWPDEWSITGMPGWGRLWHATLMEEHLPNIREGREPSLSERLAEARETAEAKLARENGFFVCLHSLQSNRHKAMLGTRILPDIERTLRGLADVEQRVQNAGSESKRRPLLRGLPALIEKAEHELDQAALEEHYEAGVLADGIKDSIQPFHRRTSLRLLAECAQAVLDYANLLKDLPKDAGEQAKATQQNDLEQEMAAIPSASEFERLALRQLVDVRIPPERGLEATSTAKAASERIVSALLTDPVWVARLPRLVSHLTGHEFAWETIGPSLWEDLASPITLTAAAVFLLEHSAPNQVLLVADQIPLELQARAQQIADASEAALAEQRTELLKLGIMSDGIDADVLLGRWGLASERMQVALTEARTAKERDMVAQRQNARRLRELITSIDDAVFEMQGGMLVDAYTAVQQGLAEAREGINVASRLPERSAALYSSVEIFCQGLRYRIDHSSWSVEGIESEIATLKRGIQEGSGSLSKELGIELVLNALEAGEFRRLGLGAQALIPSEVTTRCNLLRGWLRVRALPAFLEEGLTRNEQALIQNLHHDFAQLAYLKSVLAPTGHPIEETSPAVHTMQKLRAPKTGALQGNCILITLPGDPPKSKCIADFDSVMDTKEWLQDWNVILLAPGCTPKIKERLAKSYRNRPLVVIDEQAIVRMALAQREGKKPVSILRSMMLNVIGAANTDIFTSNGAVDAQMAIFVGRDRAIGTLATGRDSYAVYGGRRIGKSSVLGAVEERLEKMEISVVRYSFEGHRDCSDDTTASTLARQLPPEVFEGEVSQAGDIRTVEDLRHSLNVYLDDHPDAAMVFLIDEVDKYIEANKDRHLLIEAFRSLSDQYQSRLRVIVAGFMHLYDCLKGRGPYTPMSDPWARTFNDIGPLPNLPRERAEEIVNEGFVQILGWEYDNGAIPHWIFERTGGHPAFVQKFCLEVKNRVSRRADQIVRLDDVEEVFHDNSPDGSFIAYVHKTLGDNLDPISRFVILLLASEPGEVRRFTKAQVRSYASLSHFEIPDDLLDRSLERLQVTSVVRQSQQGVYEFSVPDYLTILKRLGQTAEADLTRLDAQIEPYVQQETERQRDQRRRAGW